MKAIWKAMTVATTLFLGACSDSDAKTGAPGPSPSDGGDACAPLSAPDAVVGTYGSAWNQTESAARLCALESTLTESATYVDPTIDTDTREALSEAIGQFLASTPGGSIVQKSALDRRDGELRFAWAFMNADAVVIEGLDYMEIAADGRIESIRGYWQPLPTTPPEGALAAYATAMTSKDDGARRTALGDALSSTVRFTAPDTEATTLTEIAGAIGRGGDVTVTGTQRYPKFARMEFAVGSTKVTDYFHLDGEGKITRIARFEGDLPSL